MRGFTKKFKRITAGFVAALMVLAYMSVSVQADYYYVPVEPKVPNLELAISTAVGLLGEQK